MQNHNGSLSSSIDTVNDTEQPEPRFTSSVFNNDNTQTTFSLVS